MLALASLALMGCGGSADDATSAPSTTAETTAPTTTSAVSGETPQAVPDALAFSAPLVGGGELDLATLAGRPVLLWFWAPF